MNKKKPRVFKVQHNGETSIERTNNLKGDVQINPPSPEEEKEEMDLIVAELIRIHLTMPNDLVKAFWESKMKTPSVVGKNSAVAHIENHYPKKMKALVFLMDELIAFLKEKSFDIPPKPSEEEEEIEQGGDSGENESIDIEAEHEAKPQIDSEDEDDAPDPFEQVDDSTLSESFPQPEVEEGGLSQQQLVGLITHLNELLLRIRRLEYRRGKDKEIITELSRDMRALKDLNEALPDFISTKIYQVLKDVQASQQQSGTTFFVQNQTTDEIKPVEGIPPKIFPKLLQLAQARKNILLVGPSGSGKTFTSEMLANALGLPYYSISCSEGMSEGDVKGWLLPTGAGGKFEYVSSDFVQAYENGGVFCADELDAADANMATFFNKAIGNTSFHLAIRKVGGNDDGQEYKSLLKKHKDFIFIACANTFGNGSDLIFTGRNQLDGATMDRFRAGVIYSDYDPAVEQALVDSDVLDWGLYIREAIFKTQQTRRMMTTRFMIDMSDMKRKFNWGPDDWETAYFADWSRDDQNRVKEYIRLRVEERLEELRRNRATAGR